MNSPNVVPSATRAPFSNYPDTYTRLYLPPTPIVYGNPATRARSPPTTAVSPRAIHCHPGGLFGKSQLDFGANRKSCPLRDALGDGTCWARSVSAAGECSHA
jgi:hypothetical protein